MSISRPSHGQDVFPDSVVASGDAVVQDEVKVAIDEPICRKELSSKRARKQALAYAALKSLGLDHLLTSIIDRQER